MRRFPGMRATRAVPGVGVVRHGISFRELASDDSCHTEPMKGRRTAAMLCVLLGHALLVLALRDLTSPEILVTRPQEPFVTELVFIEEDEHPLIEDSSEPEPISLAPVVPPAPDVAAADPSSGESAAITVPERGYIDWPLERREAAARVLAEEAEAERVAKMFAGPQGTWASLTKRQQSELKAFRWKPGIDGLERDERGNTIYRMKSGCTLVNFVFIGCPLGKKPEPYGDLFKDMRLYFDEQRLPRTDEGNGREPESMRPPKWSRPLGERDP
jgi:hypothetical protein